MKDNLFWQLNIDFQLQLISTLNRKSKLQHHISNNFRSSITKRSKKKYRECSTTNPILSKMDCMSYSKDKDHFIEILFRGLKDSRIFRLDMILREVQFIDTK